MRQWFFKERWWVAFPRTDRNTSGLLFRWFAVKGMFKPSWSSEWAMAYGPFNKGEAIIEAERINKMSGISISAD